MAGAIQAPPKALRRTCSDSETKTQQQPSTIVTVSRLRNFKLIKLYQSNCAEKICFFIICLVFAYLNLTISVFSQKIQNALPSFYSRFCTYKSDSPVRKPCYKFYYVWQNGPLSRTYMHTQHKENKDVNRLVPNTKSITLSVRVSRYSLCWKKVMIKAVSWHLVAH